MSTEPPLTSEEISAVAEQLKQHSGVYTRRDIIAAAAATGSLGVLGALGIDNAEASHGIGEIGTADNPLDMVHTHGLSDLESLNTQELYTGQQATITITPTSTGYRAVHHLDEIVTEDSSYQTVLQWACNNLPNGGTVHHTEGEFLYDVTTTTTMGNEGILLTGEGLPWIASNQRLGSLIKVTADANPALHFNTQFSGMVGLGIDGTETATRLVSLDSIDHVLYRAGIARASAYNIALKGPNIFIDRCWIEYAGTSAFNVGQTCKDLRITNCLFAAGSGAESCIRQDGVEVKGLRFQGNRVFGYDHGYRMKNATLNDANITGNYFWAIGKQTSGFNKHAKCFVDFGSSTLTNVKWDNEVNGDHNGTAYTDDVVHFDSTTTLTRTRSSPSVELNTLRAQNINGKEIIDNGAYPYMYNGVEMTSADPPAPTVGARVYYRPDLATPELRAKNSAGIVATLASF